MRIPVLRRISPTSRWFEGVIFSWPGIVLIAGVTSSGETSTENVFAASLLQSDVALANLNDNRILMKGIDAKSPTVLVVEDEEDTRYLIRVALETRGYRVCEAENGDEAIVMARQQQPDVILMDISMPQMNGLTATARIREQENMQTIPIIALTAHHDLDLRRDAAAVGFTAYLTKPIDFNWLVEFLETLLGSDSKSTLDLSRSGQS